MGRESLRQAGLALKAHLAERAVIEERDPMARELRGFKTIAERNEWRRKKESKFGKYWLK